MSLRGAAHRRRVRVAGSVALSVSIAAGSALVGPAADALSAACERDHADLAALPDLAADPDAGLPASTYLGSDGGLYPDGTNTPPTDYAVAGESVGSAIVPLDANGVPSADGHMVLLGIGSSVMSSEFDAFERRVEGLVNPALVLVNAGIGGRDLTAWADPSGDPWPTTDELLGYHGVTSQQVTALWVESFERLNLGRDFTRWRADNATGMRSLIAVATSRFPNLQQVFLSPRTYGNYQAKASRTIEPWAYEHGFAVRDVIADSINQPAARPWIGWGPYYWTDGVRGRNDGFRWECADVTPNGEHPSVQGAAKVAALAEAHFAGSPFAPWFEPREVGSIASITPETLGQGVTAELTVAGADFAPDSTLDLGAGVSVSPASYADASAVIATVTVAADAAVGPRDVKVESLAGVATCAACFTITGVSVAGVSPPSAPRDDVDHAVVVTGDGFAPGATADFGRGVNVRSVTFVDSTSLVVVVRVSNRTTLGDRIVRVTNADGNSGTCACFSVDRVGPAPSIVSVAPAALAQGAIAELTVSGSEFEDGSAVTMGPGLAVSETSFLDSSTLVATVTVALDAVAGPRDVTVASPSGAAMCAACLTVTGVSLGGVAPAAEPRDNVDHPVTVTGSEFAQGVTVDFGRGVNVRSVTFVDSTSLAVVVRVASGATLGSRIVRVINPDGASSSCLCFSVTEAPLPPPAPTIDSVSPDVLGQAASAEVTVSGSNFGLDAMLDLGADVTVGAPSYVDAMTVVATVTLAPNAVVGVRDVSVVSSAGVAVCAGCFRVTGVSVAGVLPSSTPRDDLDHTVTVGGDGFVPAAMVDFGRGVTVRSVTFVDTTSLAVVVKVSDHASVGSRIVRVTNPDGTSGSCQCFAVVEVPPPPVPTIDSVSPDALDQGVTAEVTVLGSNFGLDATLDLGLGVTVDVPSFVDASTVVATVTVAVDAAAGPRDVSVVSSVGIVTCVSCLTVLEVVPPPERHGNARLV
jgi:hypothetical protein